MESDPGLFRTLLEQKEKEIISLCEHQMSTLQQQVADKSTQYKALVEKFEQLQEDFKYNLALLDDRDAELAQYDTSISSFQVSHMPLRYMKITRIILRLSISVLCQKFVAPLNPCKQTGSLICTPLCYQEAAKEREQQYQNSRTALAEAHAQIQQARYFVASCSLDFVLESLKLCLERKLTV